MNKITCKEASTITGTSLRRIQQMCKNGEIDGVEKNRKKLVNPF